MVILGGYRLHWATLAVSAVVLLYLINLQHSGFTCGVRSPGDDIAYHGWPLRFFAPARDAVGHDGQPRPGIAFAAVRTLANPVCCLAVLASTAVFVERAVRRGFKHTFTLGTALAAITILCGMLALSQMPREWHSSRISFAGGALSPNLIHVMCFREWWNPLGFPLLLAFAATMHTAASLLAVAAWKCAKRANPGRAWPEKQPCR